MLFAHITMLLISNYKPLSLKSNPPHCLSRRPLFFLLSKKAFAKVLYYKCCRKSSINRTTNWTTKE